MDVVLSKEGKENVWLLKLTLNSGLSYCTQNYSVLLAAGSDFRGPLLQVLKGSLVICQIHLSLQVESNLPIVFSPI